MSLATRCPACGTVFRVVQDQLRVSQGWVRCGRCAEAFNAIEALVETPAPAPYPAEVAFEAGPPPTPTPGPIGAHSPAAPAVDDSAEPATTSTDQVNDDAGAGSAADTQAWPEPMPAAPTPTATPTATLIELPPGVEVIASDGALSTDLLAPPTTTEVRTEPAFGFEAMTVPAAVDRDTPGADSAAVLEATESVPDLGSDRITKSDADPTVAHEPVEAPSFVLQANRAERWRRPGMRLALGLGSLLAALGLAAQVTYTWRDRLAASNPSWRPVLQQACARLGCHIEDLRQIEALSVESSGLLRVEGSPVYRLSVTLRNRAPLEVAAPALDLALSDAQGQPMARRVLQMKDLNLPLRTLKAGSELPIQVPLGIGDRQVSGYTIEIFYP